MFETLDIMRNYGFDVPNSSVILNCADNKIFSYSENTWLDGKIKIVTHHWSKHPNKGAKVYKMMDDLINKTEWKDKVEFYYIGNLPDKIKFNKNDMNAFNFRIIKNLMLKDRNFVQSTDRELGIISFRGLYGSTSMFHINTK